MLLLPLHHLDSSAHNLHEIGLEASAADERAVDIGVRHKLRDIGGGHAAAVENAQVARRLLAVHFAVEITNQVNHLAGSFGGSGLAGADGPDRLIGHDQFRLIVVGDAGQAPRDLGANHRLCLAGLVLLQVLTDANDRAQTVLKGRQHLLIDQLIAFAEERAAFRVAEDHRATELAHHAGRNLAGERALLLEVHILSAQLHAAEEMAVQHLAHRLERDSRRAKNREQIGIAVHQHPQFRDMLIGELRSLAGAIVHLPIASDNCIAYRYSHQRLSSKAATPGRTRPSRNSREAPPPVETCVILSAAPAFSTVTAESPPPIIVIAPAAVRWARISTIASVPRAKAGISATPIGPFQIIV